jgi:hypothetical protein
MSGTIPLLPLYVFKTCIGFLLCKVRTVEFCVSLIVHLGIIFVNNQIDAQFFFVYIYFNSLHVSPMCSSSVESIVSIRHLVYVTLYVDAVVMLARYIFQADITTASTHRMTYTRCRIDTIDSPDDEHMSARDMYIIEINI